MSRIGKKPVSVPAGVRVEVKGRTVSVSGGKGQLSWAHPLGVTVESADGSVTVRPQRDDRRTRALHGLTRSLIANMVQGVSQGYQKRLLIFGTGYGCNVNGNILELNLGYMGRSVNKGPQFRLPIPPGLEVRVETPAARGETEPAKLVVQGYDKQQVGQFAAEIRALRKPEPYKGKGVRYDNEQVRRKQGKALTSGG